MAEIFSYYLMDNFPYGAEMWFSSRHPNASSHKRALIANSKENFAR